jgi:hypothetical protein
MGFNSAFKGLTDHYRDMFVRSVRSSLFVTPKCFKINYYHFSNSSLRTDLCSDILIIFSSDQYSKKLPVYVLTELKMCTFTVYKVSALTGVGVRRNTGQLHPVTVRQAILRTKKIFQTL